MRAPWLLFTLPLLAQGAPRPQQARPPGQPGGGGTQGRGGTAFRTVIEMGPSVHRLWLRNLELNPGWSRSHPDLRLIWNEELRVDNPAEAQVKALWEKQGWSLEEARVVLVGAEDRVIAAWTGEPRPEEVLSALTGSGWVSRLARLQDFLREHPDQGQARLALIQLLASRARRLDPDQDAALSATNAAALESHLERLRDLPEWAVHTPGQVWNGMLRNLLARDPAPIGTDLRRRLKEDVEAEILRNPSAGSLWSLWGLLATEPGDAEGLMARLPRLPGQPLLPAGAVQPLVEFHLRTGACAALEALASRIIPETPTWSADASWRSARVAALFGQRRKEEAFRTLQSDLEALPEVGFMGRVMGLLPLLQQPPGEDPLLIPEDRVRLFASIEEGGRLAREKAKARRPDEDEKAPVLRLDVAGGPAWAKDWAGLPKHPAFDEWGPSELAFGTLEGKGWQSLRERKGWGPEPRWILRKGDDVFATGTEAPNAQALADAARQQGEPRLAQARKTLKAHPDLLAIRGLRLAYLQQRMPHPRLEALLLEDAQKVDSPFLPEDFKPLPELWVGPARRKLTELEGALARWPQSVPLWRAWLDWSQVAGQGDAAALLRALPQPPQLPGEEGPLPTDVAGSIAERLQELGRLKELAAFGRPFWEALKIGLPRTARTAETARNPGLPEGSPSGSPKAPTPDDIRRMAQGEMAFGQIRSAMGLLRPWVQALRATHQGPEAEAVVATLEGLLPNLGRRFNAGGRQTEATAPSTPARPAAGSPPN